jgi:aspartyl-tRNA(Asn)/glutamyl-tRNA(Gln) amidotransferase subunit C
MMAMPGLMVRPPLSWKTRMSLDTATVRRIAALARIRLEEEEVARLQGELNSILGWIEQLQEVDTEGVEPMAGGTPEGIAAMPMREDVVTDGGIAEKILANAPDREGPYFAVPKVVE